jgi:hypothetical protein
VTRYPRSPRTTSSRSTSSPLRTSPSSEAPTHVPGSSFNHRVRKIDTDGVVTTVAGTGDAGFAADGVPATEADLNFPTDVTVDADGNLYIGDNLNQRIRWLTFSSSP